MWNLLIGGAVKEQDAHTLMFFGELDTVDTSYLVEDILISYLCLVIIPSLAYHLGHKIMNLGT